MTPRRRGTSLVEAVAAMGASAALTGIAVAALVAIGRADRDVGSRLDDRLLVSRFAKQLRKDIHAGGQVNWDGQAKTLQINGVDDAGDRFLEYRFDEARWGRYTQSDPQAEAELSSAFWLPRALRVEFEPASAEVGDVVRIRLSDSSAADGSGSAHVEELHIQVGRDAQLLHE
jgi:hypothetical protein